MKKFELCMSFTLYMFLFKTACGNLKWGHINKLSIDMALRSLYYLFLGFQKKKLISHNNNTITRNINTQLIAYKWQGKTTVKLRKSKWPLFLHI